MEFLHGKETKVSRHKMQQNFHDQIILLEERVHILETRLRKPDLSHDRNSHQIGIGGGPHLHKRPFSKFTRGPAHLFPTALGCLIEPNLPVSGKI